MKYISRNMTAIIAAIFDIFLTDNMTLCYDNMLWLKNLSPFRCTKVNVFVSYEVQMQGATVRYTDENTILYLILGCSSQRIKRSTMCTVRKVKKTNKQYNSVSFPFPWRIIPKACCAFHPRWNSHSTISGKKLPYNY